MNLTTEKIIAIIALALLHTPVEINAQPPKGTISTINHKGNTFEVRNMADTTEVLDPLTMDVRIIIDNPNPIPLKFNNMNIYAASEVEQKPTITSEALRRDIIQAVGVHLKKDGEYRLLLDNVIISDKGKVVYYNFDGVEEKQTIRSLKINEERTVQGNYEMGRADWSLTNNIPAKTASAQVEKVVGKIPACKPAAVSAQPVPCQLDTKALQKPFKIKNGAIQY